MSRSSQHKEKLVIRSEVHREDVNEGTSARTRPISYDEIMLRRKNKKLSAELVAKHVDAGNLSGEVSESGRANKNTKLPSSIVAKRSSESVVKVNSRCYEDNMGKDKILRNIRKDSRDQVMRSKPINRDFSGGVERSMDDRRDQWSRRNGNIRNEYERGHPRHFIERERYADRSRGRPIKDFDRKPANDDEERKSEREMKRKHRNEDEERSTQQNLKRRESGERRDQEALKRKDPDQKERKELLKIHDDKSRSRKRRSRSREPDKDKGRRSDPSEQNDVNKHDSGKRHDQEAPVKKDHDIKKSKEPSQFHDEESRSKKKRSGSREREMDKGTEHGNGSSHTSKDRFRREQADDERNEKSNNSSSDRYRKPDRSSSGLGGYSPRKRKTEAGVKTPSPPHRSPEKKSAGWDHPPENNNSTASIVLNAQSFSHTVTSNTNMLPSMPPVTPTSLRVIHGIFSYASVDSVQLTQATRPMRRLYVENLPTSASEKSVTECFNNFLLSSGIIRVPGSQPCISCTINKEKGQALVEFLTPEDASAALYFDGKSLSGSVLKIRRPKDYADVATGVAEKSVASFDLLSNVVRDSPNKIFVGGIPKVISSDMLREIVAVFGPLKAFHFEVNGNLGGPCAFFEYADQSVTLKACAGLNTLRLGGHMLTVLQATPNSSSAENIVNPPFYGIPEHAKSLLQKPTQVLKLKNVLNPDDLSSLSEQELEEILEDVRLECARFGTVNSINVVKHHNGDSVPEICQMPGGTGSGDDKGAEFIENVKKIEHHEEQINGLPQETVMLEVAHDVDFIAETSQVPDGTVSADNIAKDSIENLKTENCEEQIDGKSQETSMLEAHHDNNNNVTSLDNSEMIVTKLENKNPSFDSSNIDHQPLDQNGSLIDGSGMKTDAEIKSKPMVEEILKTEKVSKMSETEKIENKETVLKIEDTLELGNILVEYKRAEASAVAAHSLHGRLFDYRIVSIEYVDLDIYKTMFLK